MKHLQLYAILGISLMVEGAGMAHAQTLDNGQSGVVFVTADAVSPTQALQAQTPPGHIAPLAQLHVAGDFASGLDPRSDTNAVCRGQNLLGGLVQLRGYGNDYRTCAVVGGPG